ncbi:Hydantoinase B/oxoprolinase [compost metagenome]
MAIVSNRRIIPPAGAQGGEAGQLGANRVIRKDGHVEELISCDKTTMAPGDVFEILTPGGGAFGKA